MSAVTTVATSRDLGVGAAARRLLAAHATRTPCDPVRDLIAGLDEADAVQECLIRSWTAAGRRPVGSPGPSVLGLRGRGAGRPRLPEVT